MSVSGCTVVRRADALAWVSSTERVAVLHLEDLSDAPTVLAGSAGVIWELLDDEMTVDQLVETVGGWFRVPADDVRDDVTGFVADCLDRGLMMAGDEPGRA